MQILHPVRHFRHDQQPRETGIVLQQDLTIGQAPEPMGTIGEAGMQFEFYHREANGKSCCSATPRQICLSTTDVAALHTVHRALRGARERSIEP